MENYGLYVETPLTAIAFFVTPPQCVKMSLYDIHIITKFTTSLSFDKNVVRFLVSEPIKEEVKLCVGNYVFNPGSNKDTQQSLQYKDY